MDMKLHMNDSVKVKLSDEGKRILYEKHVHFKQSILERGGSDIGDFVLNENSDGTVTFEIWRLMSTFGPFMHWGSKAPFEGELIFTDKKDIHSHHNL